MIPLPGIRDKGGAPRLGAKGPHQRGPFGEFGDGLDDEDDHDEQHDDQADGVQLLDDGQGDR